MRSSFYSTSLYNAGRPIGSVYCTTDSIAQKLSSSSVPVIGSNLTAPGATAPRDLYTMAYQPAAASMPEGAMVIKYSRRPDRDPLGGVPVGDAVLPLLTCVLVYGVWKLRRVFRFVKK